MRHQVARWLAALICVAFLLTGAAPLAQAAKHKKSWPSKKHKSHKKAPSAPSSSGKGAAKPPAEDADEDEGEGESTQADSGDKDEADAPAFKPKKVAKSNDEDEDEDDNESSGGDDGEGTVVRKKARKPVADDGGDGAPIAFELAVGPRGVNRSFAFNDPYQGNPPEYKLPAGFAPFLDLSIYPLAFAGRGVLANIGLIASYERLVGTSTVSNKGTAMESTSTTSSQQFEVGGRFRIPLGASEVGVAATYGSHSFKLNSKDLTPAEGAALPNVAYTFAGFGADTRLRFGVVTVGAHLGTRLVFDTGPLGKKAWFTGTKTTSITGGLSVAVRVAPMFEVVGGADLVRYGFDFTSPANDPIVAGGAVDQYLSGFLALRVAITGG